WHYHGFDGHPATKFELWIGLPVATPLEAAGPYQVVTTPAFACVSALHKGSWDTLGNTYEQLLAGIRMGGLQTGGEAREHYIHCDFEHPEHNLTLVQVGVARERIA
ncbi:MAG TPA: GyrI-like domain-containing protein, partial [Chitinophaga sp.]